MGLSQEELDSRVDKYMRSTRAMDARMELICALEVVGRADFCRFVDRLKEKMAPRAEDDDVNRDGDDVNTEGAGVNTEEDDANTKEDGADVKTETKTADVDTDDEDEEKYTPTLQDALDELLYQLVRMCKTNRRGKSVEYRGRQPPVSATREERLVGIQFTKYILDAGANVDNVDVYERTPLLKACRNGAAHIVKVLLEAGADVNHWGEDGCAALHATCLSKSEEFLVVFVMKIVLAAGAEVSWEEHLNHHLYRKAAAPLLFAAGEHPVILKLPGEEPIRFFPPDWNDLNLKNQCRKVIRKHLLTLDSRDCRKNLFIRVPQLQMTNERPGLPEELVWYLLYNQSLEVDWEEFDRVAAEKAGTCRPSVD